jgi:ribosome-binding protein aMBF1 (putative translation factor)
LCAIDAFKDINGAHVEAGAMELGGTRNRIYKVRQVTEVALVNSQALNRAMIAAKHLPGNTVKAPGIFVRSLRSALRMSQHQLARRARVPQAQIARIEGGKIARRRLEPWTGYRWRLWDKW